MDYLTHWTGKPKQISSYSAQYGETGAIDINKLDTNAEIDIVSHLKSIIASGIRFNPDINTFKSEVVPHLNSTLIPVGESCNFHISTDFVLCFSNAGLTEYTLGMKYGCCGFCIDLDILKCLQINPVFYAIDEKPNLIAATILDTIRFLKTIKSYPHSIQFPDGKKRSIKHEAEHIEQMLMYLAGFIKPDKYENGIFKESKDKEFRIVRSVAKVDMHHQVPRAELDFITNIGDNPHLKITCDTLKKLIVPSRSIQERLYQDTLVPDWIKTIIEPIE